MIAYGIVRDDGVATYFSETLARAVRALALHRARWPEHTWTLELWPQEPAGTQTA